MLGIRRRAMTTWLCLLGLTVPVVTLASGRPEKPELPQARAFASLPEVSSVSVDEHGVPRFLAGRLGRMDAAAPERGAVRFLEQLAPVFQGSGREEIVATGMHHDELGQVHIRVQQHLEGLPIVGADMIVHADARTGDVHAVNGRFVPAPQASRTATLPARRALRDALVQARIARSQVAGTPELTYIVDGAGSVHLAWSVLVAYENGEGPQLDRVFASAGTGRLIDRHPQHHYAKSWKTHTSNGGTSLPGTQVLTNTSGSTSDAVINTIHTNTSWAYDYFKNVHNRDSFNASGATITSTGRYGNKYVNAFWNGTQLVYGDGDGVNAGPLGNAFDVVTHELTHAVTTYTAGLVYQNESGALNEAMSDVFAAAAEAWRNGGVNANTWKVGEDCWTPGTAGDALRYMNNPTQDGSSKDYYPERYVGTQDNGGVHWNSGIANLAFYLLVQGGTHPRGKTSIQVPGIGMAKAERIFYRALATYMTSSTNYQGARSATAQAATDLYGASSAELNAVHKAWDAVGAPGSPGGGGGGTTALQNGTPVSNLSDSTGGQKFFTLSVPSGASNLAIQISGGSGDADLYVKYGTAPTTSSYDCRPYKSGNSESCSFASPTAGTWHVMLRAYSAYSGVTLQGSYSVQAPNSPPTANFTYTVSNLSVSFTDASTDSDGSIASRSWNFGDGTTSTATNPSKSYAAAGTYTVQLTVTDNQGAQASTSKSVTVTAPSSAPCTGCTEYSGSLSGTNATQIQPNGTYYYSASSVKHEGWLQGPSNADFDLRLYRWNGSSWVVVKSSLGSTSTEYLTYTGSGYFYYEVKSYSGSGSYKLWIKK
jgi:Zn-dependent metalloprotease/PKD repeat protein